MNPSYSYRLFSVSLALFLGWAGSIAAHAQQPRVVTLAEVVEFGLEHNHTVRAARFAADAARAADREARSALLPAVRGEGSYTKLSSNIPDFELTLPDEFGGSDFSVPAIRDRYDLSLRVEQPIFTGMQLTNTRRATSLSARAREADGRAVAAEVAYAIRVAYWTLFESQEALRVAIVSETAVEAQLSNTVKRREQGAALGSDVLSLQARLSEAKLDALTARNAVEVAALRLSEIAGLPMNELLEATDSQPVVDWTTIETDVLEADALAGSPNIQARSLDHAAALAAARATTSGWMPQIFFVGVYQYARPNAYIFPQEDVFTGTWQAGLTVRWDIWDWGQTGARNRQARSVASQQGEQLAAERRSIRFAVRQAAMNVEHRRLAMSVAEQSVAEADAAFVAVERRFDVGAALTSEVLDAEVMNRNARLRQARAIAAYGIARAQLLLALGRTQADEPMVTE